MPIYTRTAAGNEAASNSKSPLPRKLRNLLSVIDGKTRSSIYINSLASFGDVQGLLEVLLDAGLIAASGPQDDSSIPPRPGSVFRSSEAQPAASAADALSPWAELQSPSPPRFSMPSSRTGTPPAAVDYPLRNAVLLISNFVTQHLPAQSLEIMLAVEDMGSVDQVILSLRSYEAMIAPIGEPAKKHLAELRKILTSV